MLYRKDYNKPNRCPGWSYSGFNWTLPWEKLTDCPNGSSGYYADDFGPWHVHQCPKCGVKTLPYATRFLDPDYLYLEAGGLCRDIEYRWPDVKDFLDGLRIDLKIGVHNLLKKPIRLYHVTPAKNLPKILEQGLVPQVGPRAERMGEEMPGVFLFETPENLRDRMKRGFLRDFKKGTELSILEVSIPSHLYIQPLSLRWNSWDYWTDEKIPPRYLRYIRSLVV